MSTWYTLFFGFTVSLFAVGHVYAAEQANSDEIFASLADKSRVAQLRAQVKSVPSDIRAHFELANIFLRLNLFDQAEGELRAVVDNDMMEITAYEQIAILYSIKPQPSYEKAAEWLDRAYMLAPNDPGLNATIASVYVDSNNYDEARKHALKCLSYSTISQERVECYLLMARICAEEGQEEQTRKYFVEAEKLDPRIINLSRNRPVLIPTFADPDLGLLGRLLAPLLKSHPDKEERIKDFNKRN
jgi:tetratricopeptide (TPR) repeat protein